MLVIKSRTGTAWVISPYRVQNESPSRKWIESEAKARNTRFVSVASKSCAFSTQNGYDFAQAIVNSGCVEDYLYIDKQSDSYIVVIIKNGRVIEDSIFSSETQLLHHLQFTAAVLKEDDKEYRIHCVGFQPSSAMNDALSPLLRSDGAIEMLDDSLLNVTDIATLNDAYEFVEVASAVRGLTDKKAQHAVLASIVAVLLTSAALTSGAIDFKGVTERVELIDEYKDFTKAMLSGDSFSARLTQDFHIHRLLRDELPYWAIYKVTHSEKAIEYRLISVSHRSSMRNLQLFANHYGMALLNDSKGVGLVAGLTAQPVYSDEEKIRSFNLDKLTSNIIDVATNTTPFATISVSETTAKGEWGKRELTVLLNNASAHDLMRIASVVDGSPIRYPSFFSMCQTHGCAYEVNPKGQLKGTLNFTIYGNTGETEGKTNG